MDTLLSHEAMEGELWQWSNAVVTWQWQHGESSMSGFYSYYTVSVIYRTYFLCRKECSLSNVVPQKVWDFTHSCWLSQLICLKTLIHLGNKYAMSLWVSHWIIHPAVRFVWNSDLFRNGALICMIFSFVWQYFHWQSKNTEVYILYKCK